MKGQLMKKRFLLNMVRIFLFTIIMTLLSFEIAIHTFDLKRCVNFSSNVFVSEQTIYIL